MSGELCQIFDLCSLDVCHQPVSVCLRGESNTHTYTPKQIQMETGKPYLRPCNYLILHKSILILLFFLWVVRSEHSAGGYVVGLYLLGTGAAVELFGQQKCARQAATALSVRALSCVCWQGA